ncbi:hypothetical protein K470DRAFT_270881 [Piedraia hortae CBS 480.64]|uniref:Uncharacterized protein n=1 Tax=Piedraia hortae CBS 480.64 TaxID=1314780 RepID=A0A6A7C072_9PEZI|nr:hypothetical protein K470DRAFT_270881 [Piedraia hortae CBS 480.64]
MLHQEDKKGTSTVENKVDLVLKAIQSGKVGPAAPAMSARTVTKPLWRKVVDGTEPTATLEVRLQHNKNTTSEGKLAKIWKNIPDARAIISHACVKERDLGRAKQDDFELICHQKLVMVMGMPLTIEIDNEGVICNEAWTREASKKNAVRIEPVSWLYGTKQLEDLRRSHQTKGSIIVEVATEADQRRVVKEGMFQGALWLPVKLWDVMKSTQSFRC